MSSSSSSSESEGSESVSLERQWVFDEKRVQRPSKEVKPLPVVVGGKVIKSNVQLGRAPIHDESEEGGSQTRSSAASSSSSSSPSLSDAEGGDDVDGDDAPTEFAKRQRQSGTSPPLRTRGEREAALREWLARLCHSLLENPEERIGRAGELLAALRERPAACGGAPSAEGRDEGDERRRLVVLSGLAIFKDVLPMYRIRELGADELRVQVSKEVQAVRDFERALLLHYKRFIGELRRLVLRAANPKKTASACTPSQARVAAAAARAAGALLLARPNFNFSTDLVEILVPACNSRRPEAAVVVEAALRAVGEVLDTDTQRVATLAVVRQIGHLAKVAHCNVNPRLVALFTRLRLSGEAARRRDEQQGAGGRELNDGGRMNRLLRKKGKKHKLSGGWHDSKQQSKLRKQEKKIARELQNFSAAEEREHRLMLEADIIQAVFVVYFRVLKTHGTPQSRAPSELLPTVLDGLAASAHLINVDMLGDLVQNLDRVVCTLVPAGGGVPRGAEACAIVVRCVRAALSLVSNCGFAVEIDVSSFHMHLYALLPTLASDTSPANDADKVAVLEAVHAALLERSKFTERDRVAAFVKRLASVACAAEPNIAVGILSLLQTLLVKFPRMQQLAESEATLCGDYQPFLRNPDHANAMASSLFELQLLRAHYHPAVSKAAANTLTAARHVADAVNSVPSFSATQTLAEASSAFQLQAPRRELLVKRIEAYSAATGGFNPALQLPRDSLLSFTKQLKAFESGTRGASAKKRKRLQPRVPADEEWQQAKLQKKAELKEGVFADLPM